MSLAQKTEPQMVSAASSDPAEGWFTAGRFSLFLAVTIAALFPQVLLGRTSFIIRDFGLFSYPVAFFHRESFWRGQLPLWNPLNFCGTPFLAQWNTLVLYPPSLIYLLFPLTWSLPLFCLAHLFWAGVGMYFLARQWTGHCLAAAVAGVIFSFNGLTLNFLMWPSHVATLSWLPWVLWLTRSAWQGDRRKIAWAIAAAAMQMLAGGPETILFTWLLLGLLAAVDCVQRTAMPKRTVVTLAVMALVVALVCAAQLLPFLELLRYSQRDTGFGSAAWAMPIWGWANLLVPLFRTVPSPQGVFQQPDQYWTSSYYVGIATILLAASALRRARNGQVILLSCLLVGSLWMALGDRAWLYRALRAGLPAVGFARYPVKFVILGVAVAPLLAAFGFKALTTAAPVSRRFEAGGLMGLLLLVAMVAVFDWKAPIDHGNGNITVKNAIERGGFLLLLALLLSGFLRSRERQRILLALVFLGTFWLDLATQVPTQNPTADPSVYLPGWAKAQIKWEQAPELGRSRIMLSAEALQELKFHAIPGLEKNFLLNRLAFLADCNLLDAVPNAGGFFSLTPAEINNLTVLPDLQRQRNFPALLDLMGVSEMTPPGKVFEWAHRPTAMPLVTAGQRPVFVSDQSAFNAFFQTNVDFRQIVLLPPEAQPLVTATQTVAARIVSAQFTGQTVSIQTEAPAPCLVVISQTYYSPWNARVDGVSTKLWRADYAFQALQVPAGKHQIQLLYEDRAFRWGLILSAAGLLVWVAMWLRFRHQVTGTK